VELLQRYKIIYRVVVDEMPDVCTIIHQYTSMYFKVLFTVLSLDTPNMEDVHVPLRHQK